MNVYLLISLLAHNCMLNRSHDLPSCIPVWASPMLELRYLVFFSSMKHNNIYKLTCNLIQTRPPQHDTRQLTRNSYVRNTYTIFSNCKIVDKKSARDTRPLQLHKTVHGWQLSTKRPCLRSCLITTTAKGEH